MDTVLDAKYVCESSLGSEHIESFRNGEFSSLAEAKSFFDRITEPEYERSDWKEITPRIIERELLDTKSISENKNDAHSTQTIYIQGEDLPLPHRPRKAS